MIHSIKLLKINGLSCKHSLHFHRPSNFGQTFVPPGLVSWREHKSDIRRAKQIYQLIGDPGRRNIALQSTYAGLVLACNLYRFFVKVVNYL